jgi:hypothetical protein
MSMRYLTIFAAGMGLLALSSPQAEAKGCNGYVNQLQWGCAAWDNNNGPQFPHYQAPTAAPAARIAPAALAHPVPPTAQLLKPGSVTSPAGGKIVAQGGGNIVAQGGGNIVAQGGGNFRPR